MIYAYIRVSTKQQNIDRQYVEIKEFGVEDKFIYVDKESGKDFDRTNYKKLIKKLKKDDLLIVKSIDRLGRNYHMILEEWAHITKTIGADIKVLDMPLLDTRIEGKNLVGKFISDIVLQVLSFVAENERTNIKQRQMEGIRIAKEKGVKFGRPKVVTPPNTNDILDKYINHEITNTEAASLIGISRGTFFRLVREHKKWKTRSVITNILINEKYCGDAILQKRYVQDYITKKQVINDGKLTKYYAKNNQEAIIPRATWELTQEISKSKRYENRQNNLFLLMIKCSNCGGWYQSKTQIRDYFVKPFRFYQCENKLTKKGMQK